MIIKRGDLVLVDLEPVKGSEQGRTRPCLVVQNDVANKYSTTSIVVPLTSHISDVEYATTVLVDKGEGDLPLKSSVLCNQLKTISVKDRVIKRLGSFEPETMKRVDEALKASLSLD